jgi:hypothetical protein
MENLPDEAKPPQSIWHSAIKCMAWIKSHHPAYKGQNGSEMLEFDDFEVERANG